MINLGVPHHFIQRYLGHLGPEMTNRYAHIHDATMREKLSEYLQGTLVDVTGKVVPEEGLRDTERVITKANANGWTRQIEMNERKRNNLVNIVTSLERTHA
jgi:hypothetical protein